MRQIQKRKEFWAHYLPCSFTLGWYLPLSRPGCSIEDWRFYYFRTQVGLYKHLASNLREIMPEVINTAIAAERVEHANFLLRDWEDDRKKGLPDSVINTRRESYIDQGASDFYQTAEDINDANTCQEQSIWMYIRHRRHNFRCFQQKEVEHAQKWEELFAKIQQEIHKITDLWASRGYYHDIFSVGLRLLHIISYYLKPQFSALSEQLDNEWKRRQELLRNYKNMPPEERVRLAELPENVWLREADYRELRKRNRELLWWLVAYKNKIYDSYRGDFLRIGLELAARQGITINLPVEAAETPVAVEALPSTGDTANNGVVQNVDSPAVSEMTRRLRNLARKLGQEYRRLVELFSRNFRLPGEIQVSKSASDLLALADLPENKWMRGALHNLKELKRRLEQPKNWLIAYYNNADERREEALLASGLRILEPEPNRHDQIQMDLYRLAMHLETVERPRRKEVLCAYRRGDEAMRRQLISPCREIGFLA